MAAPAHPAHAERVRHVVEPTVESVGPLLEDVFFALGGADGKGCLVPHGLAVEVDLVAALQRRLPELDNDALLRAMGSATNAVFTIWERGAVAPTPPKPKSEPN